MIGKLLFSGVLLFISAMVQAEEVNDTSKVFDLDEIVGVVFPASLGNDVNLNLETVFDPRVSAVNGVVEGFARLFGGEPLVSLNVSAGMDREIAVLEIGRLGKIVWNDRDSVLVLRSFGLGGAGGLLGIVSLLSVNCGRGGRSRISALAFRAGGEQ